MLSLEIEVNEPQYDEEGQLVLEDEEDEEEPDAFDGVFNAHLLEEEYLDGQSYQGSMTDEEAQESAAKH